MKNLKILKIIIAILLLINIVAVLFLWLGRPPRHGEEIKNYFINELQLNDLQQKEYLKLIDEHRNQKEILHKQRDLDSDAFYSLLQNPNLDSITIKNSCNKLMITKQKEELLLFDHFKKIRNLCDERQKQKFDIIIKNALRMFGHDGKKKSLK